MPWSVYVLAAGIFAMTTSEFAVAGLMPQLAAGLDTGIEQIGYLVTVFAVAMTIGGPALTVLLLRATPRSALLVIFAIFLAGNVIAALANSYWVMVIARVVGGVAAQAFFGISVSLSARLVDERMRGRANGVAMSGLMLGTLLGMPLATFVGGQLGWRAAFWTISALTVVAALLTLRFVQNPAPADVADAGAGSMRRELVVLRRPQFVLALVSSTLIIGATFSAFSFFTPILTDVTGLPAGLIPLLLVGYGAATLVGNTVVARLADRRTVVTLLAGTALNAVFLAGFALFAGAAPLALVFMLGIGLVGVTMNPAMAVRVQRAGSTAPLVNTIHASFITLGVILGSAIGSALIPHYGLRAPLLLGCALAVLALVTIIPALADPHLRGGTSSLPEELVAASARPTSGPATAERGDPGGRAACT
ncbi:MFS transporter [Aeromicrobium phragmitis]|uniref:MFS transporter n=1 Tax=Aeromicrobium phragmitis TaxID=2478914 RepID=A0A3L8PKB0_9ACTN|nr:MFS transporter [Aeromicrobium phragmitis]